MTGRKITVIAALLLVLLALTACGGPDSGSRDFEVEYVGSRSIGGDLIITGSCGEDRYMLNSGSAFADCSFAGYDFATGDQITLGGTPDGLLKLEGGIILHVEDAEGVEHEIPIDTGSVFQAVADGDSVKLLLPED
ncbi:MAG: hypothetical protein IKD93_08575 [Firmicutes bacterium]|nr:hypothetical protein [Bacillota bacterium]